MLSDQQSLRCALKRKIANTPTTEKFPNLYPHRALNRKNSGNLHIDHLTAQTIWASKTMQSYRKSSFPVTDLANLKKYFNFFRTVFCCFAFTVMTISYSLYLFWANVYVNHKNLSYFILHGIRTSYACFCIQFWMGCIITHVCKCMEPCSIAVSWNWHSYCNKIVGYCHY